MTTNQEYFTQIRDLAAKALADLGGPVSSTGARLVRAGESLQAALDVGGPIQLEAATYEGNFVAMKPTSVVGVAGTELRGAAAAPVFTVPPGARKIALATCVATTPGDGSAIQIGTADDTQKTLDAVPAGITLTRVLVPRHRGKRAFEINGADVLLTSCGCTDVYDPAGRDSQGIWIGNTPGWVTVQGGLYEAGSENVLVGGAGFVMPIPGLVQRNLAFLDLTLAKPLSWREDGIKRKVKCLLELKSGLGVTVSKVRMSGCWSDAQVGYAVQVTPRDGGVIGAVVFDDVTLEKAGSFLNVLGQDDEQYSEVVSGLVFRRVAADVTGELGSGRFAQWGGEPSDLLIDDCDFTGDGTVITTYAGVAWDTATLAKRDGAGITKGLKIQNSRFTMRGGYGLFLNGFAYGRNWQEAWPDGVITGNVFTGAIAAAMAKNLPAGNTFQAA
jgi:hypothetical protein